MDLSTTRSCLSIPGVIHFKHSRRCHCAWGTFTRPDSTGRASHLACVWMALKWVNLYSLTRAIFGSPRAKQFLVMVGWNIPGVDPLVPRKRGSLVPFCYGVVSHFLRYFWRVQVDSKPPELRTGWRRQDGVFLLPPNKILILEG